jgi:hypothetical protein
MPFLPPDTLLLQNYYIAVNNPGAVIAEMIRNGIDAFTNYFHYADPTTVHITHRMEALLAQHYIRIGVMGPNDNIRDLGTVEGLAPEWDALAFKIT